MEIVINGSGGKYIGGYDWDSTQNINIMNKLKAVVVKKLDKGEKIDFMFNGQLGIPQMACNMILELKKSGNCSNIGKITLVLAHEKMKAKWFGSTLEKFESHLKEVS